MDITVVGRNAEISSRLRDYVEDKAVKVEQFDPRVQRVEVEVTHERNPRQADTAERVEITVVSKGPIIRAEASSSDRFAAFDIAMGKLTERLRRARDRKKDHHRRHTVAAPNEDLQAAPGMEEPLLPVLIEKSVPVNALTAYAGWNTASNAIGTALSEALLYHCAMQRAESDEKRNAAAYANLAFLTGRIAEDAFYLKETIDRVNNTLRIAGYQNTADLDLTRNWRFANDLLVNDLNRRIRSYESTAACRAPFQQGDMQMRLVRSNSTAYYPWPRTFEVRLESQPAIEISP